MQLSSSILLEVTSKNVYSSDLEFVFFSRSNPYNMFLPLNVDKRGMYVFMMEISVSTGWRQYPIYLMPTSFF